jgi:F-type H+-transporting ATPase subunit a
MNLSPDQTIFWSHGFITINLTLVTTWILISVMATGAWLITRKLKSDIRISRWQSVLEIIVVGINNQIEEVGLKKPENYIAFLGTLFLFIGVSNLCIIFPGYEPPTASLSTTAALAICVFFAVPFFGIA